MGEAASGGMESAGVVLKAVDQFSANIQKYLDELRQVQVQNERLSDEEQHAADMARRTAQGWDVSGQKAAKYALAAGALSGQMRMLGIQNQVAAHAIGLASDALTGSLGVIGGVITAVGALAAGISAVVRHTGEMREQVEAATTRLAAQAAETGILNEAERMLLAIRRTQIQLQLKESEVILQKAQAMKLELGLWEKLAIAAMHAQGLHRLAAAYAAAWTVAKNDQAIAEHLEKLRALKEELENINLAFEGGRVAIEARKQAEEDAAKAAKDLATAEREAAEARAAFHQQRVEQAVEWLGLMDAEMAKMTDHHQLLLALFKRQKEARDKEVEDEKKQAAERSARLQYWANVAQQAAATVGAAIGAAAAGSTSAWRAAGIAMIQIAAHAASRAVLMWAAAQAAIGNWAAAIRAAAGAMAIEGLAAAGVAYLQERESRRRSADDGGAAPVGGRGGGPSIGVESVFAPRASITQNISGDVSPAAAAAWQQSAQAFLDGSMDKWLSRKRAQGYRFA